MSEPSSEEILQWFEEITPRVERIPLKSGRVVLMKKHDGEQRWRMMQVQDGIAKAGGTRIPPALIVAVTLCRPDGEPLFDDLEEGFKRTRAIDGDVLTEMYGHALRVTGLGERALEEAEKKSSSSQSEESGTSSPSSSADAQ
jgi:hypothetical protein